VHIKKRIARLFKWHKAAPYQGLILRPRQGAALRLQSTQPSEATEMSESTRQLLHQLISFYKSRGAFFPYMLEVLIRELGCNEEGINTLAHLGFLEHNDDDPTDTRLWPSNKLLDMAIPRSLASA
jgi:hypothetical protein